MSLDGGEALHDQLLGRLLLVEGDEAKVLRSILLQLVHWSNDLNYRSKLGGRQVLAQTGKCIAHPPG